MGELESSVQYLTDLLQAKRKAIFWILCGCLLLWLMAAVKEVTTLLLFSYAAALLLDPVINRLGRCRISRSAAVILLGAVLMLAMIALVGLVVPSLAQQYRELIQALPDYLHKLVAQANELSKAWLGFELSTDNDQLVARVRGYLSAFGADQLKVVAASVGTTVLHGYSLTLTVINLFLLPFFIYYIAVDLHAIHKGAGSLLREDVRTRVAAVCNQIMVHVHAFFRGQLTVASLLAVLYIAGLWIVGLPSAFIVGLLSGLLNMVPYLGIGVGLILSTIITLVTEGSFSQLLLVWGVFAAVQLIEGSFLTPKIVGESVGIHPLGVMLALIIGGQLWGLLGLIIAIPAAAAARVLFNYTRHLVEEFDDASAREIYTGRPES